MHYTYRTRGTCSRTITFDLENNILSNVSFEGGCPGNLQAISKLVEGAKADQVAAILKGNTCGMKPTSCADQLSKAITEALKQA